jgi:hypothetical protein
MGPAATVFTDSAQDKSASPDTTNHTSGTRTQAKDGVVGLQAVREGRQGLHICLLVQVLQGWLLDGTADTNTPGGKHSIEGNNAAARHTHSCAQGKPPHHASINGTPTVPSLLLVCNAAHNAARSATSPHTRRLPSTLDPSTGWDTELRRHTPCPCC